jgi:signal transduction histidine kinase/ligand-binding sensor domain-containing protein
LNGSYLYNKLIALILTLLCLLGDLRAQPTFGYRTFAYTTENGLPSNGLKGMQWDEKSGFLWIATEAGISRFNGIEFVNFTKANTSFITSERIRFMTRNLENQIRAADMDGNVIAVSNNKPALLINYFQLPKSSSEGWYTQLIGAGISDTFFKLGPIPSPSQIGYPFAQLVPLSKKSALFFNPEGTVVLIDMVQKKVAQLNSLGSNNLMGFYQNGNIYIQKKNHEYLWRWNQVDNNLTRTGIKLPAQNINIFWETGMEYPIAIADKQAWAIYINDKNPVQLICNEIPNLGRIKYVQHSATKGLLFLGTSSQGFSVVRSNRVLQKKKQNVERGDVTAYYSQWKIGPTSILTNEGHIVGSPASKKAATNGKFGFSVYQEGDSLVWFSSEVENKPGGTLQSLNNKKQIKTIYGKIEIYDVFAFARWKNEIVIGDHNGVGLIKKDSLKILFPATSKKGFETTSFSLLEITPGVFSMASCAGWIMIDLNKNKIDTLLKLPGYCIRSQLKIGDYVFIGTYGKGIYIYKDGKIKSTPLDKNLFLQYAHCFVRDNLGYVWISTNRGLFKASTADMIHAFETNASFVYYHYLGKNDGMEMTELNGGCSPCGLTLQDGTLSFPSMDGLLWVHPSFNQPLMPEGPIFFDKLSIDNQIITDSIFQKKQIPFNFKKIEISLGYAAWANIENIYIEYRTNETEPWIPLLSTEGSVIRLAGLTAGDHLLQIRKRNGFGKDNFYYLNIPFSVGTAWYDNTVFYIVALLTTLLLIYTISSYQNRRLLARQKELELLVQAKTQDLQEQYNVLEKSNRINNRLISIISHDIVTPLKFLTATGRGLYKKKIELPEETQKEILEEIINTSQELHLLSTNILNWIKYQSGNKRLLTDEITAKDLTEQVLTILQPLAKEKNLQLINNVKESISFYQFVEPLKILLYNLVLNSIRYSDQGVIEVNIVEEQNTFTLSVCDNGWGMSNEKIESLIKKDAPAIDMLKDNKGGHGLGYLIIRDIISWMQAQIQIHSTIGKGTEVYVMFRSLKNQSVNNR